MKVAREEHVMSIHFGDQLLRLLPTAAELYHRLILVVAPGGGGKSAALRSVAARTGAPVVNLNLELSAAAYLSSRSGNGSFKRLVWFENWWPRRLLAMTPTAWCYWITPRFFLTSACRLIRCGCLRKSRGTGLWL